MEKILTIVIPTYNMQDYLRRCLDSLIVPEEQMKQLEVFVVNDGSKDNSSAIAHEYQDKYPDTFRVIDKENNHYGSCVNRGLKEATGKFFRILDADDWFDTQSLSYLISQANNITVDVIYTPFDIISTDFKDKPKIVRKEQTLLPFDKIVDLTENALDGAFFYMHALTYRLSFLKAMNYKQEEKICYTDTEYVFYPLSCSNSIYCLKKSLYQYYVGREGQSMSHASLAKNFNHFAKVLYNLIEFNADNLHPTYHKLVCFYYVNLLHYMIDAHLYSQNNIEQEKALQKMIQIASQKEKSVIPSLNSISVRGCYYVRWWLNGSMIDKMRLSIFMKLFCIKRVVSNALSVFLREVRFNNK